MHVPYLNRMGANIKVDGKELKIKGKHDNVEVEGIEGIDIESSNVP